MGRAVLFLFIIAIAACLAVIKSLIGRVSGNKNLKDTSLKGETKKVMDTTAKGVSWMEKQWEESKKAADLPSKGITKDDS